MMAFYKNSIPFANRTEFMRLSCKKITQIGSRGRLSISSGIKGWTRLFRAMRTRSTKDFLLFLSLNSISKKWMSSRDRSFSRTPYSIIDLRAPPRDCSCRIAQHKVLLLRRGLAKRKPLQGICFGVDSSKSQLRKWKACAHQVRKHQSNKRLCQQQV